MPNHFANPGSPFFARMTRQRVRATHQLPANDNTAAVTETHLNAALQHFAKHGLAAAQHARRQAINAARAGDRQTFEWWLEICRALDRPMARKLGKACESVS